MAAWGWMMGLAVLLGVGPGAAGAMTLHQQEIAAWRASRVERLTAPEGWLSLVGLHWVETGKTTTLGNGDGVDVDLGRGPVHLGELEWQDDKVYFVAAPKSGAMVGEAVVERVELLPADAREPVRVHFGDTASLELIERGGRHALRVRDSAAPARAGFSGISYFDIDPTWRIEARFERYPEPRTIEVATVVGTLEAYPNPGRIVFERDGKAHSIEALVEEGSEAYFLIIADRSSGKETYGMARYLYAGPEQGDRIVIDFNRAYNPPCVFTDYATCPMPPEGNRLDLYVAAGEKIYRGKH
ncbi:MAG: DUF1684 domain-containing protein [Xanthomonadales bacterium]|nr:hypothetical protein [Xanthomonadales bacterium]MCC6594586.1 DUF1684 domain-containing protein [Xanthomonadales bacterium]